MGCAAAFALNGDYRYDQFLVIPEISFRTGRRQVS
jgi:hypothetical protein